ncbi:hypothetical protein WMY93_002183 [Mugilogobius chulae]|uniref:Uncharacterized protein n=1 Tax=Mugilogobius chulae TaxID=88201 RepID=A0AAW0Q2X8_9GOBI
MRGLVFDVELAAELGMYICALCSQLTEQSRAGLNRPVKATRLNGALQRGCLPVPHRGLCAVTLRVHLVEERVGVGSVLGWAPIANSVNPPGPWLCPSPSHLLHLHPSCFPSSSALLSSPFALPLSLWPLSFSKLDLRPIGPDPSTGRSQLANQKQL